MSDPDNITIGWNSTDPICTCGREWCSHIIISITRREDVVAFYANIQSRTLTLPVARSPRYGQRGIPKTVVNVSDEGEVRFMGSKVIGYLEPPFRRMDMMRLTVPYLYAWEVANPCHCHVRQPRTFPREPTDKFVHDIACRAAYRIASHNILTCWTCDTADLVPDLGKPTYTYTQKKPLPTSPS